MFPGTGLCEGKSPMTGELPTQRDRDAENVSIWWRHHWVQTVFQRDILHYNRAMASIHWAVGRLTAKSREVVKPRVWMLQWSHRSAIWQASRQQRCWVRCLSNCRAIGKVRTRISRLRDFTRSWCKTSVYGVNRDPDVHSSHQPVTSSSRIPFTMVIIHSRF